MIIKCFWRCFVSLVKFSFWSKFHVNIITGSRVIKIFFYKVLTKNLRIRNTPAWVFPNIWRIVHVMYTKFCTDFSKEMLLNAAKCQDYSFYGFWVIKGKPNGGRGITFSPPWLELIFAGVNFKKWHFENINVQTHSFWTLCKH